MNFNTKYYDAQIGRFLSVDPLMDAFPSHSPYSYSFNNPISYSDPTGLAPEKEKGCGNEIQHMNWFELLKESWQQYNVEYQNSWMIEKILEKLNRDMFWNDQLNSLIAMANNADIGVDESADMARKARQGRLGIGRPGGSRSDKEKGAWEVKRDWNENDYTEFQEYYRNRSKELVKEKAEIDCADVQYQILMEYAYKNNLPLTIYKKNGDSFSQEDFNDFSSFLGFVQNNFSTADLPNNTFEVNSKNKIVGDMVIMRLQTRTSDEFGNEVILDGGSIHCVGYQSINPIRSFWGTHISGIPQKVKIGGNWIERQRIGNHQRSGAYYNTRIPNMDTVLRWKIFK